MATTMGETVTMGNVFSYPDHGDEVCITGISGSFPDSNSVIHLQENLFNKVDLISGDCRRWNLCHAEIPQRTGKINNIKKFDAAFFGVHYNEAHTMDPLSRILMERTYEAIIDAGLNPNELSNTRTGVFVSTCFSESEKAMMYQFMAVNQYGFVGCSRAMLANRISSWLGVTGPSYNVDTACSSSLTALQHAYRALRAGQCETAIVAGLNLCLSPYISLQFFRLGVLSPEGICRTFDNDANGYVRSEAIVACVLQKAKDSRRIYAQIVHAKTNCDGYKDQGITFPSKDMQHMLLSEFYEECNVAPSTVEFVEAHGTGTQVGDPLELNVIGDIFCSGRSDPLMIGSIKSNLGHSEPASGLCSVAKLCIAYTTGYIPPNINYEVPRAEASYLMEGKLKVVTEKQPWGRGLSGINSFGFGGANVHVLLKNIAKPKDNNGLPSDDLPRLVCVSGRTESAVAKILDELESKTVDVELVRLLHAIYESTIHGHVYRGYTLLESTPTKSVPLARNIQYVAKTRLPVSFVYSGICSDWPGTALQLMRIPLFVAAIEKCDKTLKTKGINLIKLITNSNAMTKDDILNSFVGVAAVQIGLTDVLKAVRIKPDFIIGHGVSELVCAYADGCLTAEETILSAYYIGLALVETQFVKESMAVIEIGYKDLQSILPSDIEVVSYNGLDSSTIFGPEDKIKALLTELVAQGIVAMEVSCHNIAYHSRHIADTGPTILKYLKQTISIPKPRSERWLSTSIGQGLWKDRRAQVASAEYFTNSFLNPVLFEETVSLIPANAITIEIGPDVNIREILRQSDRNDVISVSLIERKYQDNVQVLFTALGKLYEAGLNPHLANIYPTINFPVSQGTPMLAHLVEWEHSKDWTTALFDDVKQRSCHERIVRMSITNENDEFMAGHVVDGRNLYPATGYLLLVWDTLELIMGKQFIGMSLVFEDVRFHRATHIPKTGNLEFTVTIQEGSGLFEVVESGSHIVTGRIYTKKNISQEFHTLPEEPEAKGPNVKYLLTKGFYKELRLRGYQYSGLFRGVLGCNVEGTRGRITWKHNWVTFLDCMMQIMLINKDTRGLFVPTSIEKLSIDINKHSEILSKIKSNSKKIKNPSLEVRVYPSLEIIRSGGVELQGLYAAAISRKIPLGVAVLEKNVFIPNIGKSEMKIEDILRTDVQLVLENLQIYKFQSIEIVDDEYKNNGLEPIMVKIADILGDLPLVQANLSVISEDPIEMPSNISVENKKLTGEKNTLLLIGANLLQRPEVFENSTATLRDKGFIISREKGPIDRKYFDNKYDIITTHYTGFEYIVLFRKRVPHKPAKFVKIVSADQTYAWIDQLKEEMKDGRKVVIYSQDEEINGLLGLINCLRKEPGGEVFYGLLIADSSAPPFNPYLEFYAEQLDLDLAINVYKEGQWGTYRHLLLGDLNTIQAYHAYVNTITIGDLSSLTWLEGPIRANQVCQNPNNIIIHVYSSALNFRDVMAATGRVTVDAFAVGRLAQDCVQGFEVSGRTRNGTRVMGMMTNRGMANMAVMSKQLLWSVPDEWTLEEAATVPVAYATVYYALVMIGHIQRGESILIHAGSGGVGQAAINVALHYGCEVFTTVSTPEKRAFIKRLFPQVKDSHIGNSRSTSFEDMIRKETKGKGVDMVLNSLAEEKLQASIRCLGYRGRFLEIGKFDISKNTLIDVSYFLNEISFHGIVLDTIFFKPIEEFIRNLQDLILSGIESGAVRPLTYCTFEKNPIEAPFRYMAAGKHIGKIIVKINDEERNNHVVKPSHIPVQAITRYTCDEVLVYIVVGGLGGFGLELADWLITRGARKVLLTSRKGISNGYQSTRLKAWASYGADVQISTHDVTTEEGCEQMLKMANAMGKVEAMFNLAVVLKDSIFENQSPESFRISFGPKGLATMNLDKLSRQLCPELKDFVIFSSVSCGRGNAGQTNYGFSNSVMERICESRKKHGFPALAVQWGVVGDVGLVADMQDEDVQLEIGGTLQQRISSCLLSLDKFLSQDAVIVSSMVVAEKKAGGSGSGNIVDAVAQIMGIKDLKNVSQQVPLADLGMDSMMAVEIKQTLEREFEIFLTASDIRTLTFTRLTELSAQKEAAASTSAVVAKTEESAEVGAFQLFAANYSDEVSASKPFIYMPSLVSDGSNNDDLVDDKGPTMFLLPGIEGCAVALEALCRRLKIKTCVLQYYNKEDKEFTLHSLTNGLYKIIKSKLLPGSPYTLLGYSFGIYPALKLASMLENEGHNGTIYSLDGSPEYFHAVVESTRKNKNDFQVQNDLICKIVDIFSPKNEITEHIIKNLQEIESYEERINYALEKCPPYEKHSKEYIKSIALSYFHRFKIALNNKNMEKVKAPIILLRPKNNPLYFVLDEKYGLDKLTDGPVTVHLFETNHFTIIDNKDCANTINRVLAGFDREQKDDQEAMTP